MCPAGGPGPPAGAATTAVAWPRFGLRRAPPLWLAAGTAALDCGENRRFGSRRALPLWPTTNEKRRQSAAIQNPARAPGHLFAYCDLAQCVLGYACEGREAKAILQVHINHLRRKLGDDARDPRFIRCVRGAGYRWDGHL